MHRRHLALPRLWLLTDERQGDGLWPAIAVLPHDAGVIVRHYTLPLAQRIALARRIARSGRFIAFAGIEPQARRARAQAVYGTRPTSRLPLLYPAHSIPELRRAKGAALVLLSPAFPTRSHPGARALGPLRFGLLARDAPTPVIALGGMDAARFKRLRGLGADGWAAIDGLTPRRIRT